MKLKVEYLPIGELKTYANNAKRHPEEQVEQIKKSIRAFGFNDPIALWKNNEIIEGHGRLYAAMELGLDTVPVIRLDDLTDEQRRAYALVHNKLTMNSDFDADVLAMELDDIESFDMGDFGFEFDGGDGVIDDVNPYSTETKIPQYVPTGEMVTEERCYDTAKADSLIDEIENADIDEQTKRFLTYAAYRHVIFNYKNIAEFYANADKTVQNLMEKSALVIIDINDAIADGYVKLSGIIDDMLNDET